MSSRVFVRPTRTSDREKFFQWAVPAIKQNELDPAVLNYKTTFALCAFDVEGPLAYLPIQHPFMMESLAVRPGASPQAIATALKELVQYLVTQMYVAGVGEIYFVGTDPETNEFAARQGFERLPWPVYRLKLGDLETLKEPLKE